MSRFAKLSLCVFAFVLVLGLAGCGGTTESKNAGGATSPNASASADAQPSDSASEVSDSSFKDGTLTTPEMKIVITSHKVILKGKKGNEYGEKPVIAFWYKVTNVSGEDLNPSTAWIFAMKAYQDNNPNAVNELGVGSLPDDRFLDTQMEKIKKGGTVANAVAYELDDLKTPVDLVALESAFDDTELGRMQVQIKK